MRELLNFYHLKLNETVELFNSINYSNRPQESLVWPSNSPLVSENVETGLKAQITTAHQVGDDEES